MKNINFIHLFENSNIPLWIQQLINIVIKISILAVIIVVAYFIGKYLFRHTFMRFVRKTKSDIDDVLFKNNNLFLPLNYVFVAIVVHFSLPHILGETFFLYALLIMAVRITLVVLVKVICIKLLKGIRELLEQKEKFRDSSITGLFQIAHIIVYCIAGIFIASILLDQSPAKVLGAIGAMTAIVLLIFKDTILGIVASIQIHTNNLVKIGDWITVPKYNADGDVISINLNTIKIKNFDKTITTIPTYSIISDSFKNWKGIEESKARRIKTSLNISLSCVHFIPKDKLHFFHAYISKTDIEYLESKHSNITNLTLFRQYVEHYLKTHTELKKEGVTTMVRLLQSTEKGIPLEIYAFTQTTNWIYYENIQSSILEHIIAMSSVFAVTLFEDIQDKHKN